MSRADQVKRMLPGLLRNLANELDRDPELVERLVASKPERGRRAVSAAFDPFEILKVGGETALRQRLESLDIQDLRLVLTQHGLDTTRLAQKWRDKQRLVSFIVERIAARAQKGEVFMAS